MLKISGNQGLLWGVSLLSLAGMQSALASPVSDASASFLSKPKLIVVLSVDQFRADFLSRFRDRFLPKKSGAIEGGYRALMEEGAYFPYGEQVLAQSMTGPGHAAILSGALPYANGIPSNYWFHPESGKRMYCTGDPSEKIIGSSEGKKDGGTSPRNFNGTTVGDELKLTGYTSKVVSIALKDRSSILMGGRRPDLAMWFEPKAFKWVTSSYYLKSNELPPWLNQLNTRVSARKGTKLTWTADGPGAGVSTTSAFPHEFTVGSQESLSGPTGVELTIEAAEAALSAYELGKDSVPDLLAVSLSTHDYIGHQYGPNSRESEEITVYEDRAISRLLNSVRQHVPGGLREVVFVLTADHGAPAHPDWVSQLGLSAGRLSDDIQVDLERALQKRFGAPSGATQWIALFYDLGITFHPRALASSQVSKEALEEFAREFLQKRNGVFRVQTSTDAVRGIRTLGPLSERWITTYLAGRSPDVVIIPQPGFMGDGDGVSHQTSWSYDRMVPIVFFGKGIRKGVYPEKARVIDIAPTLSWLLGILPPAMSEGIILRSALK